MAKAPRQNRSSYGIGEWYGRLYRSLTQTDRQELLSVTPIPPCPFIVSMPALASRGKVTCNKNGGVCSLRAFIADDLAFRFGPITATCPNRFLDGGTVFSTIARTLLGDDDAVIVKEVPFLIRPAEPDAETGNNEDVGRIDMVMIRPGLSPLEWCAVEMQAVYFSGGAMSKDIANIRAYTGNGIPGPGAGRRPDFRSCGPKRLMPQLQTKVPTLRRWGKKMAVVVDRPFFDSFGPMDHVPHVSNADIVWFIVRFDENEEAGTATLAVDEIRYTTLERAVEGLTAGIPTSLEDFENKIRAKLR